VRRLPSAVISLASKPYVAAGAVYYSDGSGVVRRLDPTGKIATVATFPLTSAAQTLSFAVHAQMCNRKGNQRPAAGVKEA